MKTITRTELWESIEAKDNLMLVEALSQKQFDKAHLPGAIRLAKEEVDIMAPKLLTDKAARIVVYCAGPECQDSPIVAGRLMELGYTDVSNYKEGKTDWMTAGLRTESTPLVIST